MHFYLSGYRIMDMPGAPGQLMKIPLCLPDLDTSFTSIQLDQDLAYVAITERNDGPGRDYIGRKADFLGEKCHLDNRIWNTLQPTSMGPSGKIRPPQLPWKHGLKLEDIPKEERLYFERLKRYEIWLGNELLCSKRAIPELDLDPTYTDDFNRSDETPLGLRGNIDNNAWEKVLSTNSPVTYFVRPNLSGNQVTDLARNTTNLAQYNAVSFTDGSDQSCTVTVSLVEDTTKEGNVGVVCKSKNANFYLAQFAMSGTDLIQLLRHVTGLFTLLASTSLGANPPFRYPVGTTIGLSVSGSTIKDYKDSGVINTVTDAIPFTVGQPGLRLGTADFAGSVGMGCDNWITTGTPVPVVLAPFAKGCP